jgi:gamma-glutamyltranspeptidase/glutathione hydrolase
VLVVGGAGGPTIIMGAVQAISNVADFHLDIASALDAARVDARAYGSLLAMEDTRIAAEVIADLESRGHQIQRLGEYAPFPIMNAAGVVRSSNQRQAATDPRGDPAEQGAAGQ